MIAAYRFILTALVFAFLMTLILSSAVAFGQEHESVQLSELDRYKLLAAESTASFETLRIDTVIRNFIEANPQVKAFQDSAIKSIASRDALRTQLYQAAGLSPLDYELKDGAFVKIDKATAK